MRGERRRKPASARSADAGFTLIEVVVAMVIIGGSLLTVLAAASSAFAYQDIARQRQTAVGIANEVLEKIHALPYAQIQQGVTVDAGDPHAKKCGRTWRFGTTSGSGRCPLDVAIAGHGEELLIRSSGDPLAPLSPNNAPVEFNGHDYHWYSYISRDSASDPYRITAFVDWTWRGTSYSVNLQTLLWVPEGCVESGLHPVAGPCTNGRGDTADISGAEIEVTATGMVPDFSLTLGRARVTYAKEQVLLVSGSYWLPTSDNLTRTATADDDPTNGVGSETDVLDDTSTGVLPLRGPDFVSGLSDSATWHIEARYQTSPTLTGKTKVGVTDDAGVSASCANVLSIATGWPCAASSVKSDGAAYLVIEAVCNPCPTPSGTVWSPSSPPLRSGSPPGTRITLLQVFPPWSVSAALSGTSATARRFTMTREFPTLKIGYVSGPGGNRFMSEFDLDGATSCTTSPCVGDKGAQSLIADHVESFDASGKLVTETTWSRVLRSPSVSTFSSPVNACADVMTATATTETATPYASWNTTPTRCFHSGSLTPNSIRYVFAGLSLTPSVYSATSTSAIVTPTTLKASLHLEYCTATTGNRNNLTCSAWRQLTPNFTLEVSLPAIELTGGDISW